ncbi:MAG: hypothetical protein QQN63_08620 [Nitrosopumilus sp.]
MFRNMVLSGVFVLAAGLLWVFLAPLFVQGSKRLVKEFSTVWSGKTVEEVDADKEESSSE